MARLGVQLRLSLPTAENHALTLEFNGLDDFHPDRIFARAELFQALRDTRARLIDPKTFAATAAEVRQWLNVPETREPSLNSEPERPATGHPDITGQDLLNRILKESSGEAGSAASPHEQLTLDIQSLVQEVVGPFLVPDDAEQNSLIAALDQAMGGQMRALLHHPDFQALEAAWRALYFLVSRLENDTQLKIYLLDISFNELRASLTTSEDVEATGLYTLLVESTVETFGGEPWALLAGNYFFDLTSSDAELLSKLSIIAQKAKAPFVAGATSMVVGCESLALMEDPRDWQLVGDANATLAWDQLRKLPSARYVGLALPRFLLRLPFGSETDETEGFAFEEMPEPAGQKHDWYLWGNPCFCLAYLLGNSFLQSGWDFKPGECLEIEGLPIHVYRAEGETRIKPCAETLLTVRAAEKIIDGGPMPILTMKDTGTIRVGVFQSLALPATNLLGRWYSG